jgi:hypothetical protein
LVCLREADAASSNRALIAKEISCLPHNALLFYMVCLVHQLHLATSNALRHSMGLVSSMYSLAALLRTPGYFVRLLRVLPHALEDCLDFIPPSRRVPYDQAAARSANMQLLNSCGVDTSDDATVRLLDLLNFPWHWDALVHACPGPHCCRNKSDCVSSLASLLASTVTCFVLMQRYAVTYCCLFGLRCTRGIIDLLRHPFMFFLLW